MESRSLEQIQSEQIAELLRERAERYKKKQDICRATHKEHLQAAARFWEEDHKEERRIQKGEWEDANRDHIRKYRRGRDKEAKDSAQYPCKDCGKLFGKERELDRHQALEVACKLKRDAARTVRLTCGGCERVLSQMHSLNEYHRKLCCPALRK